MATFILLASFTDQGIRNVKETTKRAEVFRELAKKCDVNVKELYWTVGQYDVVATLEAPDAATVTAVLKRRRVGQYSDANPCRVFRRRDARHS